MAEPKLQIERQIDDMLKSHRETEERLDRLQYAITVMAQLGLGSTEFAVIERILRGEEPIKKEKEEGAGT